jgi:hypothetical protein
MFLENFDSREDVFNVFNIEDDPAINMLFAWYGYGDYCGSAFVLFEKEGKMYEVNGSHCSCNGLEGDWDPEEVEKEHLLHRINEGSLGAESYYEGGAFAEDLKKVLNEQSTVSSGL